MRGMLAGTGLAMMTFAITGAMAAPAAARDRTGYQAIAIGDYATAEQTLDAERRIFPGRPELMLNLAAVYARTGRSAQAAALYRDALAAPAIAMEMPNGDTLSSRDVARRGQGRLATVEVATAK